MDKNGQKEQAGASPEEQAGRILDGIQDPLVRDALYRRLWYPHVLEDVDTWAEDNGEDVPRDVAEEAARIYVYEGRYDCCVPYWSQIGEAVRLARQRA